MPLYPGFKFCRLPVEDRRHSAMLVRLGPGVRAPRHAHHGPELTLILDGGYQDEFGTYRKGDLVVAEAATAHRPVADTQNGCTCLIVNAAPLHFTGRISVILNIFVR